MSKSFRRISDTTSGRFHKTLGATLTAVASVLSPACAYAQDQDRASFGEWIVLLIVAAGVLSLLVLVPVLRRRNLNKHTRLPSKVKTRRFRGPLGRIR